MLRQLSVVSLIAVMCSLLGCAEMGTEGGGASDQSGNLPDASVNSGQDTSLSNSSMDMAGTPNGYEESEDVIDGNVEGDGGVTDWGDAGDASSGLVALDTEGCGNGVIESNEECDDGNNLSGDGCAGSCATVEETYVCPMPGEPCLSTVVHGDGRIDGEETCDDFNTVDNDGCTHDSQIEPGWSCVLAGQKCQAKECGDGILAGREICDDGNIIVGDGCSETCTLENGWVCSTPGTPCVETVCNDGVPEGMEPCDDGNNVVGDGCTPFCEIEPDCSAGACQSQCGDGIILPGDNEACDDGNVLNGDGCSDTCQIEAGFECEDVTTTLPEVLSVPITFRDFIARPEGDGERHPDFEIFSGSDATPDMVSTQLGVDGKPVYTGICEDDNMIGPCPYDEQTTSEENFDTWYRDTPGVNITEVTMLSLERQDDGSYYFPDDAFFPWDDKGWIAEGLEGDLDGHNFGFTSEIRYWFEFQGGEYLKFSGDDDVWVFINGQLVVDLGGLHPRREGEVLLDETVSAELSLEVGRVYEIVLFHAERHTAASNFNLTLAGFTNAKSTCRSICGDGIVTGDEICDDGVNDGSYGTCLPDCTMGDYCGDGIVQSPFEVCDDGVNMTVHSRSNTPGCAPGCVLGGFCGDGKVDSLFGEECDDGENTGNFGSCNPDCIFSARCGDGILQTDNGEVCDDGNSVSGDGCSSRCQLEISLV